MLAGHALAAAALAAGVEDAFPTFPLSAPATLTFASLRVLPPTAVELALIQRADIVIEHPQYTVTVANPLGL